MGDKEIKVFDLFAGAGGFGLGFKLAGYSLIGSLEKDAWAIETLKHNDPYSDIIHADIRKYVQRREIEEVFNYKPDVIIGGPPCQGFSVAGPAKDPKDPRNSLFRYFSRWVGILKPTVFVMENVKGILSRKNVEGRKVIDIIKEEFQKNGYHFEKWILNAADYGVPQFRDRIFLVGNLQGKTIGKPSPTHTDSSTKVGDLLPYITVEEAISDLPNIDAGEGIEVQEYVSEYFNDFQRWARGNSDKLHNHVAMKHTKRLVERFKQIQQGYSLSDLHDDYRVRKRSGNGELSNKEYHSNYRHLKPAQVSYTIPAHFYSNFIHPFKPRNITAREAAKLQSFPDWYVFKGKRTQISSKLLKRKGQELEDNLSQYNQIGNSVPPLLAKSIAVKIKSSFSL